MDKRHNNNYAIFFSFEYFDGLLKETEPLFLVISSFKQESPTMISRKKHLSYHALTNPKTTFFFIHLPYKNIK